MHIPDGFLDLSICAAMYGVMMPFWIFAFGGARRNLSDAQVPLMATLTAMFFAAQMMNYPVISATTGHLLGGPILAITLGPYAGLISMTIILLIQALLFGDGGITTFGANVWNMGVIGVFVPYAVYLVVFRITKSQRGILVGAFFGALIGDVLAATFAGIELGFSTQSFPYSVPMAVTAMATHHLIMGIGEGVVTAAIISVLQKTRPDLLRLPKLSPSWMKELPTISQIPGGS